MKVNSIFHSIQGEGIWTGSSAIFIRLSGCNLRCSFCDTEYNRYRIMTVDQIIKDVINYKPTNHIVLTGGEPGLQRLEELVFKLQDNGFYVQIETNGMHEIPACINYITCSPKTNNTDSIKLNRINELKLVIDVNSNIDKQISRYIPSIYKNLYIKDIVIYLSPENPPDGTINKEAHNILAQYVMKHPQYKLSIQTHKIIGVE